MTLNFWLHVSILALFPPLLLGVINRVKAYFSGKVGPSLFQLYFDLFKLFQKGMVISTLTTWVFAAAPLVTLVSMLLAGLLMPFGPFSAPFGFTGDFILFLYLFGLSRFFTTLAALDTGSAFEGMGAAREISFASLSEPALMLAMLTLAKVAGSLQLGAMLMRPMASGGYGTTAALALTAAGLFVILLAENCRIPVDDPSTHLELTMIHEAMVLDHSGPLLGVVLYAASIKLFLFMALLLHVLLPAGFGGGPLQWGLFLSECILLAGAVGVVESIMARLRLRAIPTLLVGACLLCGFALLLILR